MYKKEIDITTVSTDIRGLVQASIKEINSRLLANQIFSRFESTKIVSNNYAKYILNIIPDQNGSTMLCTSLHRAISAWDTSKADNDRERYFDYLRGLFISIPDIVRTYAVTTIDNPSSQSTWDPFQHSLYEWLKTVDQNIIVQSRSSTEKPFLLDNYEIRLAISSKILAFHDYKLLNHSHLSIFQDPPSSLSDSHNRIQTKETEAL